ncbi:MAG: hypothetical protein LBK53_08410 [Heliobacteriaceae bacterium]|jgi:hypothetical protein|nr:hypothetical protein [Heliobacteriaceae bacterium]
MQITFNGNKPAGALTPCSVKTIYCDKNGKVTGEKYSSKDTFMTESAAMYKALIEDFQIKMPRNILQMNVPLSGKFIDGKEFKLEYQNNNRLNKSDTLKGSIKNKPVDLTFTRPIGDETGSGFFSGKIDGKEFNARLTTSKEDFSRLCVNYNGKNKDIKLNPENLYELALTEPEIFPVALLTMDGNMWDKFVMY